MTAEAGYDEGLMSRVRSEAREWLAGHWSAGKDRREFLGEAVDAGWARPSWPRDLFGRDLPDDVAPVIAEELEKAGAPVPDTTTSAIVATVIRDFAGSAELRGDVLRGLLTGEYRNCLLYSEPGAGSDLAAVQTRADRDGDEWVVNGQKVRRPAQAHA
jgi:alkylation response protein AidB-like acyl-CoA dehydrogenase